MLQKMDPRNKDLQIYVNGTILHRDEAKISVFDSVVQGGDAVWEGLRVYKGRIFCCEKHLDRLRDSAHALWFQNIPKRKTIKEAIFSTLRANKMSDGVHIRLTLTRGEKITSGMDPRLNQNGCGLIVLAEYKEPVYDSSGIKLATVSSRRNNPAFLDSKIHHANLLNNILAKVEANMAGADAGLMLDNNGFVAEANGVNVFAIKGDLLLSPTADACLPGITRGLVLELAQQLSIPSEVRNVSLSEFYSADQVFVTGTMGELTAVYAIDGRAITNKSGTEVFARLQEGFRELTKTTGTLIS